MALFLILISVIIFTCVLLNNVSSKLGIPVLLFVMVMRGEESIIPRGDTVLERNDVLVLMNRDNPQNT